MGYGEKHVIEIDRDELERLQLMESRWREARAALEVQRKTTRGLDDQLRRVVEVAKRQVADMETAHDLGETFPLNVALSTNALEAVLAELEHRAELRAGTSERSSEVPQATFGASKVPTEPKRE